METKALFYNPLFLYYSGIHSLGDKHGLSTVVVVKFQPLCKGVNLVPLSLLTASHV